MTTGPLSNQEQTRLVESWIARYESIEKKGDGSPQSEALFWAYEQLDTLCRREPEVAWPLILQILGRTNNDYVLENLAAGPLETLLACHGAHVIERVEARAAANPRFKALLAGVWKNLIPESIWERIERSIGDRSEKH